MNKVGILTFFHDNYNYGAVLQAFALQKAVEKLGYDAYVLDYKRSVDPIRDEYSSAAPRTLRDKLRIRTKADFFNVGLYPYMKLSSRAKHLLDDRKAAFRKFSGENMKVSRPYGIADITAANDEFDAFICGSDQIWRPSSFDPNFFLDFADPNRLRFAYAASIGVHILSDKAKKIMLPLIDRLDFVSVREQEAKTVLDGVKSDVQVVLDPTLLWDEAFWKEYAALPSNLEKGKYVFCYFIGENSDNRKTARAAAKRLGLPLVTIPAVSKVQPYDFMYADVNMTGAGPEEFLGLIQNAAMVITDSFHACVFSIMFGTRFYAVERFKKNDANSMNGRIYDLLALFALDDRLVSWDAGSAFSPNADTCVPGLDKYNARKDASWSYLKKSLEAISVKPLSRSYALPDVYACQSLSTDVRMRSSSGGIFYHLARRVFADGGKVIACRMNSDGIAVHDVCTSMDEIAPFLTSKYVQSRIGDMYIEADRLLRENIELLFVGTPCQIQGLLNYLALRKTPADKLIAADLICHGVPSPAVWKEYYAERTGGADMRRFLVNFRAKTKGWKRYSLRIEQSLPDGGESGAQRAKAVYESDVENDLYLKGFIKNLYLRPSCYACRFKSIYHSSDLTLGDFWHFDCCETSRTDDDTGISLVVAHSAKGDSLLKNLDGIAVEKVPCGVVSFANKAMVRSVAWTKERAGFFDGYEAYKRQYNGDKPMIGYLDKCLQDPLSVKIKKAVKKLIRR